MRGADWRGSDLGLQLVPDGEGRFQPIARSWRSAQSCARFFAAFPKIGDGANSGVDGEQDEFYRVERAFLGKSRASTTSTLRSALCGSESSVLYPLFEQCSVPSWILSRQGGAFSVVFLVAVLSWTRAPSKRFHANYELAQQFEFYEVWRCRKPSNAASAAGQPVK